MLTPDEIASRQFLVALRGYDRDEVTRFLRQVADQAASLQARIGELEQELEDARSTGASRAPAPSPSRSPEPVVTPSSDPRDAFRALGEETTRVLVAAEESAAAIREKAEERAKVELEQARREAREEIEGARRTASKIVADAERRRSAVAEDIRGLEGTRDRFMTDLRGAMKSVQSAVRTMQSTSGTTELTGEDEDDPRPVTRQPQARRVAATTPELDTTPEPEPEPEAEPEPELTPEPEVTPDATDEPVPDDTTPEPAVEEDDAPPVTVEAAIAVDAGDDVADETEEDASADAQPAEAEPAPVAEAETGEVAADDDGTDPIGLRDQSLSGVRPGMLRRLKRALQDVQNGVLDAIRQADEDVLADDLLPADDDLEQVGAVAQMFLTAAYRAGVADGAILADVAAPDDVGGGSRVTTAAGTFRLVLTNEVSASLLPSLRAGLEAGEPDTSLSERVGEVFRDLKGPVVEGLVEEHLVRVYGYGAVDLWRDADVSHKAWVVAQEPRCPENRCRTNAAEGPVAVGAEFPSGHQVAPAHDGCTCALVPQRG